MTVNWVLEIESLPKENVEHLLGDPGHIWRPQGSVGIETVLTGLWVWQL